MGDRARHGRPGTTSVDPARHGWTRQDVGGPGKTWVDPARRGWTRPGSNRPPPVCKTGALPDELRALGVSLGARTAAPRWPGSASSPVQLAQRSPYPPQPARVTAAPRPILRTSNKRYSVIREMRARAVGIEPT